jgi:hypothetical protein
MLHPYATDSEERKQIPLYLAALAILSAIGLSWVLQKVHWPGWLDAPATAGFYGLYYELFRKRLWRADLFHKWGWVKVPVLAGKWDGNVATSFDEQQGKHPIHADIVQDWTHISIKMRSEYSRSESLVGSIVVGNDIVLDYEYRNDPLPGAVATMHVHRGTASLVLSRDGRILAGDYYSGRDRQNYGSLRLQKKVP